MSPGTQNGQNPASKFPCCRPPSISSGRKLITIKTFRRIWPTTLLATALACTSISAFAGETFGNSSQWKFIHVTQFQPSNVQCGLNYFGQGYESLVALPGASNCTGTQQIRANVDLPEGAILYSYYVFYYATSGALSFQLWRFDADLSGGGQNVTTIGSSATTRQQAAMVCFIRVS